MKSQYRSSKSVAKNKTVPIAADDPRVAPNKIAQTIARQGAEVEVVGLNGKYLVAGGTSSSNSRGSSGTNQDAGYKPNIVVPGVDGRDPYETGFGKIVPTSVTNVVASWSGDNLVITFDWDYQDEANATVAEFIVELTADGVTKQTPIRSFLVNKTQTAQSITVTKVMNEAMFGIQRTSFSAICVLSMDPFYNKSDTVCAAVIPTYVLNLPVPVITVTAISNGYSVNDTTVLTPEQKLVYNSTEIVEYESDATAEPTGVTYVRSYFGSINPANIISQNNNARWVKARYYSDSGLSSNYSAAQKVTPTSPITIDNTPPNEVSNISASWSGDNITLNYKLPAQDAGSRIQIQLTAPNSLVGYFYRFPDGSGRDQVTTITKKDLFDQFGEHYSSFTGLLKSVDQSDNRSAGASFNVPARANPLTGVTPTFSVVALSNGYSVSFTLPTGAAYGEVYAKHTPWVGDPTDDTYVVYSGLPPAVITDTDYTTVYIKIRLYDDFGNNSNYSIEKTTTPLNPGQITSFETPISFGANAVIYAGASPTTGTRTIFKSSGIFAYDSVNTAPSTQIVSNAIAGSPTFITTQAQIADWKISNTTIENTLSGAPSKYTGLSATGTYAFWAGSDVSGGNSSADFTVTPSGAVTARNISIIGNGNASTNLISAGGLFTVKNDGTVSATSANISGSITASSGSFTGKLSIGGSGGIYSGTLLGDNLFGAGFILTSDGLQFNSSTVNSITSINALTGKLITKSASIGNWDIDANTISKTGISGKGNIVLDSLNGYIYVTPSVSSTYKAGINSPSNDISHSVFWAGQGSTPNDAANKFRVTVDGKLYASDVELKGNVRALSGGFGTFYSNNEVQTGWSIDSNGLISAGAGRIKVGNYDIKSDNNTDFWIVDSSTSETLLRTDTADGYGRIYLGQQGRQVELAKNAEISGTYTGGSQDYRSGGLRNMYTITVNQFNANPTAFPSAGNGAVLLVYDPNS